MIESLTQSQIDRLPEFREKWSKIALCTTLANRREAEEAINKSYVLGGLAPPKEIVWHGSPLSIADVVFKDKSILGNSVKKSVRNSTWPSVRYSIWAFVANSVRNSIGNSARDSIGSSIWDSIGNSIWNSDFSYGQHDATWLATHDYFREVCGLREETEKLTGLIELAKHAGWWKPYKKICLVSERHNFLSLDARGRLHSLSGPATTYPDGWKIYVVHGVTVPEQIVEDRQCITVAAIESEINTEVRRVMTEVYGHERYIRDSGAELIAKDELGELYRKNITDDEPLVMVKVINSTPELDGSSKEYWLRVDPELRPLLSGGRFGDAQEMTARNAIASTFGKYGQEYIPSQQT